MAAERKPRAFDAMREDRVRDMAARAFGREFGSKREAVEALSSLPVDQQHALKKRADPAAPVRPVPKPPAFSNELRGGVAAPTPERMHQAPAATLRRYLRATTGLEAKSKAQALTLLRKFGPTDVARAADQTFALGSYRRPEPGPSKAELVARYRDVHGVNPPSKLNTKAKIAAALPQSRRSPASSARMLAPIGIGLAAAVAFDATRSQAKAAGLDGAAATRQAAGAAVKAGAVAGVGGLAVAGLFRGAVSLAPRIAPAIPVVGWGLAAGTAAYGAVHGFRQTGTVSGAAIGAVTGGYVPERMQKPSAAPRAYLDDAARARSDVPVMVAPRGPATPLAPPQPVYIDHWTDKNGKLYTRHDMSVRTGRTPERI